MSRDTIAEVADRLLFGRPEARGERRIRSCLLAALFVLGAAHWADFFHFGNTPLAAYDWVKESAYLRALAEAVRTYRLPWRWSQTYFQGTQNLLGNPEIVLTPDIVALRWIDPAAFVLGHTLLFYAAGFAGMMLLAERFGAGLVALSFFFILFNLNGYVTSHLAVGHFQWTGYFLLPLYLTAILRLAETARLRAGADVAGALWAALLVGLLFANGSFHIAIWCLLFLLLAALFRWRLLASFAVCALTAGFLAAWRWVPAAYSLWGQRRQFSPGYRSVLALMGALASPTAVAGGVPGGTGWWEYDMHVGFAGLAVLVLASALLLRGRRQALDGSILAAAGVMLVLSFGDVWSLVGRLPVPFAGVERAPSRFIVMPFLVWLVALLAGLDGRALPLSRLVKTALLLALPVTSYELALHVAQWRPLLGGVPGMGVAYVSLLPAATVEPAYALCVYVSWTVSALALLLVTGALLRARLLE